MRKAAALLLPLVLVAGLLLSGDVLAAALQRNLGHLLLLAGTGPCGDRPSSPPVGYLERAVRLRANSPSAWRALLRARGWSDRQGIRDALGESPPDWADPDALRQAAETLRPPSWAMEQPWTEERCRAAWDAWTLGLVWAMDGRWPEAVAAYQAGLGLAPGRVPAEIVQEYYLALARHNLAAGALPPERELAAAKYLALGGEPAEATERFRALLSGSALDLAREGQAECWVAWLGDGAPPPGPGACTNGAADPDRAPNWVLPFENTGASALEDPNLSRSLWGFDLDADILEAGAEVLGTLYWRGPAGEVFAEDFRQANLWPNSGTSWLPLEGFAACLPGYVEPAWVPPCAGTLVYPRGTAGNPAARIHVAPAEGPDTFIVTAGGPVPGDRPMVYGGRWRVAGDFPRAHMARYGGAEQYTAEERRAYYEIVVDLSYLAPSPEFSNLANLVPPLSWDQDFAGWMRPRSEIGEGDFEFDDVFGFALPAAATGAP